MHCLSAWPLEENNLVALALGALVIGFWLGKIMDEKYFNFQNPDNIVLKITFVGLAIVGFIQLNVYVENLFNIINIGHNIEAISFFTFIRILYFFYSTIYSLFYKFTNKAIKLIGTANFFVN